MKTLEEIQEEVAKEFNFTEYDNIRFRSFDYQKSINNEVAKRYAKEVAKASLKIASENYTILFNGEQYFIEGIDDESNIPEL